MIDRSASVRSDRSDRSAVRARTGSSPRRRAVAAVAVLAAALGAAGTLPASAAPSHGPRDAVRKDIERLVTDAGFPAALVATADGAGRARHYTAGVADLRTKGKVPVDGRVRAGSNTKTFTATVVLQLVGEGKVDLDAPVEKYLPNLLRGDGVDGRAIKVRQLLQHTSGLPEYTAHILKDVFGKNRHTYYQPRDLLDIALKHKADFAPGKGWAYSNTNYVVAGLLIEKVTGRPLAEQLTERVIDRVGLRRTYFPGVGDEGIKGPHPRGYDAAEPGAPLKDVTKLDPSWGWAAGQLISTPGDLNRFFSALLGGKLLEPAQLAQMRTTVKVPDDLGYAKGARYGLGLIRTPLSCGGAMWGHGGSIPGSYTYPGVTEGGRAATIAVTANREPTLDAFAKADAVVDAALCRK
ncbi:serine hydrolase domain-containing protein [Streptomyces spectabilis]|uniref:D-alanyl-D-alanine carboxypeptidase n=1 Tax=Streptomyces spectabilis TaxID=68270 RepID=A0A7W8AWD0_STRST|nr:serine hydrolase domain-containing protein [Streptomyces spectabilis]MBB5105171.1 D-alanyl-D-alanine carboxypeptidase [Streptomyces spectabilis]MCI3905897.1 beta-lactamase family protein [Streptomyces spectabilis]GGV06011.1 serine hydrolase [Streptomyces spectabilis]